MMNIGDKIKENRLKKGITQEQLGELLNVSRSTVSGWEVGRNYPDLETLLALSSLFDISVDSLLKENYEVVKSIDFKHKQKKHFKLVIAITTFLCLFLFVYIIFTQINQPKITFEKEVVEKGWEIESSLELFDKDEIKNVQIDKNNIVTITFNTPISTSYEGYQAGGGSGIASIDLYKKRQEHSSPFNYEWTTQIDLSDLPKIKDLSILVN